MDEVRETVGIRRDYYRDRLFGRQDGEGQEEQELQIGQECEYIVQEPDDEEEDSHANGKQEKFENSGGEESRLAICD
jgi:hypothetical protein